MQCCVLKKNEKKNYRGGGGVISINQIKAQNEIPVFVLFFSLPQLQPANEYLAFNVKFASGAVLQISTHLSAIELHVHILENNTGH